MEDFTGCRPVFQVADLEESVSYYVGVLGFTLDWRLPGAPMTGRKGGSGTAFVYRGGFELLLRSATPPIASMEVVVGLTTPEAVDAIDLEYVESGAMVLEHPHRRDWGTYEMRVVDPDGHLLRILR